MELNKLLARMVAVEFERNSRRVCGIFMDVGLLKAPQSERAFSKAASITRPALPDQKKVEAECDTHAEITLRQFAVTEAHDDLCPALPTN
jgi:hypothetical protein